MNKNIFVILSKIAIYVWQYIMDEKIDIAQAYYGHNWIDVLFI